MSVELLLEKIKFLDFDTYPHASNLVTQISNADSSRKKECLEYLAEPYCDFIAKSSESGGTSNEWLEEYTNLLNRYLATIRSDYCRLFKHQSDFISSVIPEYVCCIFKKLSQEYSTQLQVGSQKNLMVEMVFSPHNGGIFLPKYKKVDAAIILKTDLTVSGKPIDDFGIPLIAVEIKTNLDKNMISGIQHSVDSLKRTFPESLCYVLAEFSDFNLAGLNYANTTIDEIFILRQQKRSEYRASKKAKDISYNIMQEFVDHIKAKLGISLDQQHSLKDRMIKGKLIVR